MSKHLSAFLVFFALFFGPAAGAAERPTVDDAALLAAHGFAPDELGYVLFDLTSGQPLKERNEEETFIPASVSKLPTMMAALDILGADHRFKTTVLASSAPVNGTVTGDLYLRGGGDPMLFNEDLEELVLALRTAGVRRVTGHFYYDTSLLQSFERIDTTQPDAATYNPGISPLTLNFNRVQVRWDTNKQGQRLAQARAVSKTRSLPIDRITFGTAAAAVDGAPFLASQPRAGERWLMSPRLSRKGYAWLPVRDAGAATAEAFRDLAEIHGISLPPARPGTVETVLIPLAQHESDPLGEIASLILKYSNNLSAELVGLAASRRLAGGPLGLHQSSAALQGWLQEALPNVDWQGFRLVNHSGLSSASRVSPRQMGEIVRYALSSLHGGADFAELLAPIRWEGEINEDNDTGPVDLRVRAKTGTMSYARGLAGYLQTASGRTLGFALFISDPEQRAALDATADPRILLSPPESHVWTRRARALEKDLVSGWLLAF